MKNLHFVKISLGAVALVSLFGSLAPAAKAFEMRSDVQVTNQEKWPQTFAFAAALQNAAIDPGASAMNAGYDGFASVVPDLNDGSVDLYWVGDLSEQYKLMAAAFSGIVVRIHTVERNFAELTTATLDATRLSPEVTVATVLADASGISVTLSGGPTGASSELQTELETELGVSVEITRDKGIDLAVATRAADTSPYSGGALYVAGTRICSTGFGVINNSTQLKYILTAYHCFHQQVSPLAVKATGSGATIGTWNNSASLNMQNLDSALYRPTGGVATNTVYVGGPGASVKAGIFGALTNVIGMNVCTSGGNTGEHCTTVIDSLSSTIAISDSNGTPLYTVSNVVKGHVTSTGTGFSNGDSGGPVYGIDTNVGSAPYRASGIITAGANYQTCTGQPALTPSQCFATEYWVDAKSLFAAYNLSIAP